MEGLENTLHEMFGCDITKEVHKQLSQGKDNSYTLTYYISISTNTLKAKMFTCVLVSPLHSPPKILTIIHFTITSIKKETLHSFFPQQHPKNYAVMWRISI